MRIHEKMKLMDRITQENIWLNIKVKLLKELYNVQGQKQGKISYKLHNNNTTSNQNPLK